MTSEQKDHVEAIRIADAIIRSRHDPKIEATIQELAYWHVAYAAAKMALESK